MIEPGTKVQVRSHVDAFGGMKGVLLDDEKALGFQCRVRLDNKIPVYFMYDELEPLPTEEES